MTGVEIAVRLWWWPTNVYYQNTNDIVIHLQETSFHCRGAWNLTKPMSGWDSESQTKRQQIAGSKRGAHVPSKHSPYISDTLLSNFRLENTCNGMSTAITCVVWNHKLLYWKVKKGVAMGERTRQNKQLREVATAWPQCKCDQYFLHLPLGICWTQLLQRSSLLQPKMPQLQAVALMTRMCWLKLHYRMPGWATLCRKTFASSVDKEDTSWRMQKISTDSRWRQTSVMKFRLTCTLF